MKKVLLLSTFFCFALLGFNLNAQMADGSFSPNFEAPDIDGNMHNLYDVLKEDKKVILDFGTTWCGPCWSYHTSGVLEELYDTYGPEGTDELRIFMLESDDSTTAEDLAGTGSNTAGDWITGTHYPIIDNAESIARDFEVAYYPTMYTVCGDGKIYESGQISAQAHADLFMAMDCQRLEESVGVASRGDISICDGDVSVTVDILNSGSADLTSASIVLDGCSNCPMTQDWTGSLSYLEGGSVDFIGVEAEEGTTTLTYTAYPGGSTDATDMVNQNVTVGAVTALQDWKMVYSADCWPVETTWTVADDQGNIFAAGGPYDQSLAQTTIEEEFSLPTTGCFIFTVFDSYGDGFNGTSAGCPVNGSMIVTTDAGNIIDIDGTTIFSVLAGNADVVEMVNNDDLDLASTISIAPNPATDMFQVTVSDVSVSQMSINVIDIVGKSVYRANVGAVNGTYSERLNVTDFASGVYSVVITMDDETIVKKVMVD